MKQTFIASLLLLSSFIGFSQIPTGYYDNAAGLSGDNLRLALFNIIKGHNSVSYATLWTSFPQTDKHPGGNQVWDMYSDNPNGANPYEYFYSSDQCGNYAKESDCYNREHSMPKSWFNSDPPLYTDLFHLYPTDGYVNGKKSNYSFGEVGSAQWTSQNGSKLGICNYPGYTSTTSNTKVFEPIDEYKGDFARSYFYIVTRYRFQAFDMGNGSDNDMVIGNGGVDVVQFTPWAESMLLKWAADDTVSQKEIDRNNAVYQIQGNRNPFIDRPEFAAKVFGSLTNVSNFENSLTKVWYSNNTLTVTSNVSKPTTLVVYNMLGEQVTVQSVSSQNTSINVDLPNGIYLASLGNNQSNTLKFVVN